MGDIIPVPQQDPNQIRTFDFPDVRTPWSMTWWNDYTVTGIPGDSVGWLLAQQWRITGVSYDNTTTPPTPTYAMSHTSLDNTQVLQSLLNSYTVAYNDARWANQERYNQVIEGWKDLNNSSQDYLDAQVDEQNEKMGQYLTDLGTYMDDVDSMIDSNQTQFTLDVATANTALTDFDGLLDELETNANNNADTVDALLTAQAGYLTSFLSAFSSKLDELDTNYSAHLSDIETLLTASDTDLSEFVAEQADRLGLLEADYSSHSSEATRFLDGLGDTELARINEQYDASLAEQLQQLTDRGLYSSAVASDITARNTRDRQEAITALNDRLNREQWENQHRLYDQQQAMRNRTLDVRDRFYQLQDAITKWQTQQRDRLLEQLQQVELQNLAGIEKQHAAQQDVSRVEMGQRDQLLGQLQDAVKAKINGKERYSTLSLQKATTVADETHRAITEKINEYNTRLDGLRQVHADNMRLMAYHLDERNKLLIGLYGFVERREDVGPSIENLATITTGLGDASGGWVTP